MKDCSFHLVMKQTDLLFQRDLSWNTITDQGSVWHEKKLFVLCMMHVCHLVPYHLFHYLSKHHMKLSFFLNYITLLSSNGLYVSPLFLQCWMKLLSFPIIQLILCLKNHRRLSSSESYNKSLKLCLFFILCTSLTSTCACHFYPFCTNHCANSSCSLPLVSELSYTISKFNDVD